MKSCTKLETENGLDKGFVPVLIQVYLFFAVRARTGSVKERS